MKYYALYKLRYNSRKIVDLAFLFQDDRKFYDNDWIRPIEFDEILNVLSESDRERNDLRILNGRISLRSEDGESKYFIFRYESVCLLCEDNDDNYLRTILLRLGNVLFIEPNYLKVFDIC